jgi:hypothetical protein
MTALAYEQEILAEDKEDVPGALWTRKAVEESRVAKRPIWRASSSALIPALAGATTPAL